MIQSFDILAESESVITGITSIPREGDGALRIRSRPGSLLRHGQARS